MTSKLNHLFVALLLLAGASSSFAQVTNLGISAAGGQSILYWPTGQTSYVLQTTANLASPNWVQASNAVAINAVVVTNSAPAGYFRLLEQADTTAGMAPIPAGNFLIGNYLFYSAPTNETVGDVFNASPTNVYVSAFYMDVNLVSRGQWANIYAYATNHGYSFVNAGAGKAADHPVHTVNWFDCVKWCNARSVQAGLVPVYYVDEEFTQVFTNGDNGVTVYQNMANNGYRLPTEAEWERAARGGIWGCRYPWGNGISASLANYNGNTNYSYDLGPHGNNPAFTNGGTPYTSPVGSFPANAYGLYDMSGNVFQWCWDWYNSVWYGTETNNPTGPTNSFSNARIVRGGCWVTDASLATCSYRYRAGPTTASFAFGFRCVRRP